MAGNISSTRFKRRKEKTIKESQKTSLPLSWHHHQNFEAITRELIQDIFSIIQLLNHNLLVKSNAIDHKRFLHISVILFGAG